MARTLSDLTSDEWQFLADRHVATLSTLRDDGRPHVVAIAFTVDPEDHVVRIITSEGTQKVRNVDRTRRAAVAQVDGPSWFSLEGPAVVTRDQARIDRAVVAYERRYRPARENPNRVAIEISDVSVLGAVRRPG
jgi:PPOX class probable F420-dependent enzyme